MAWNNYETHLDHYETPFTARLTSVQAGTGDLAGLWIYGFVEQMFDPTTGFWKDADTARTDNLATPSAGCYAVEVSNRLVAGLTSTPPSTPLPDFPSPLPSPLPYVYADLRFKCITNGCPIFQFDMGEIEQFIKPTSATAQTITLPGGATIQGYPAKLERWSATAGTWSDSITAWFLGANGETPASGTRYLCKLLGVDADGVAIWGDNIPSSPLTYLVGSGGFTSAITDNNVHFANGGFTLTAAGTYLIMFSVSLQLTPSGSTPSFGNGYVQAGVKDTTAGIELFFNASVGPTLQTTNSSFKSYGTAAGVTTYTPGAVPAVLDIWAQQPVVSGGVASWQGKGTGSNVANLVAVKVS